MYWDACAFIGLINQEVGKAAVCKDVWHEAETGETVICTSFLSFAEVFRMKCEGQMKPLAEAKDKEIEDLLSQPWILPAVVDGRIGRASRLLLRNFSQCKKPTDGIHLATALAMNVDEMHTFDGADLLTLDGKVNKANGKPLTICTPRVIVRPADPPGPKYVERGLFDLE